MLLPTKLPEIYHLLSNLSAPTTNIVTVDYHTTTGNGQTATEGADYTATNGTLTFAAAETTKTVMVPITDDGNAEPNETFTLALSNQVNATLGDKATATGTIIDNDGRFIISITASGNVTEGDMVAAFFRVHADQAPTAELNIALAVIDNPLGKLIDGTAPASVTIAAQTSSAIFSVRIADDDIDEPGGEVIATLIDARDYDLGMPSRATVHVSDDEQDPELSFANAMVSADEPAPREDGSIDFEVRLNAVSESTITVDYQTIDDTASSTDGVSGFPDFDAAAGTLRFEPGETSKTIAVTLIEDGLYEDEEQFYVELSNPQLATFADASTNPIRAVGIINATPPPPLVGVFNAGSMTATEGDEIVVTVETILSDGGPGPLFTVDASIVMHVASIGSEFRLAPGPAFITTTIIPVGERTATLTIATVDNAVDEADGFIAVSLTPANNYHRPLPECRAWAGCGPHA